MRKQHFSVVIIAAVTKLNSCVAGAGVFMTRSHCANDNGREGRVGGREGRGLGWREQSTW